MTTPADGPYESCTLPAADLPGRLAEFDAAFIELARAVYRSNDERSRIKRAISELLGSDIIEEKQYVGYRGTE